MNKVPDSSLKLVGIHGFKQSGKDTTADFFVSEYGYTKYAYANKLKEVLSLLFNIPIELLHGSDEDKNSLTTVRWDKLDVDDCPIIPAHEEFLTIRELMQIFATNICRRHYKDIWIETAFPKQGRVVVSDVRFQNEAEYIHENNGLIIAVKREAAQGGSHESEQGIDPELVDAWIDNDGTLEELHAKIAEVVKYYELG